MLPGVPTVARNEIPKLYLSHVHQVLPIKSEASVIIVFTYCLSEATSSRFDNPITSQGLAFSLNNVAKMDVTADQNQIAHLIVINQLVQFLFVFYSELFLRFKRFDVWEHLNASTDYGESDTLLLTSLDGILHPVPLSLVDVLTCLCVEWVPIVKENQMD